MRTLNLTRVLLSLIGVTLLTLAAAARTDADTGGLARVRQAIAAVDARASGSGAPSGEPGETIAGSTAEAVSAAKATPAASASNAAQSISSTGVATASTDTQSNPEGNASAPSSDQGAVSPSEASGTPVSPPQPNAGTEGQQLASAPSAPTPGASTASISEAVQEAIGQATTNSSYRSGGDAEGTIAAESNATTQLIWQVQISECTSHCSGIGQYQAAEQQSTTHQALVGAPPAAAGIGAQATNEGSQAMASVTQIQLGCVSHCFGTTTTAASLIAASLQQAVEALIHQIATALLGLIPTPAVEQDAVEQISYQSQREADGSLVETQVASQASTTTQEYDASSSALIGELESALSGPQAASYEAVNQTEQGIWQLQIGCLIFCEKTEQYQQAEQSSTTLQTVASTPGSHASTPASLTDTATQLIWQAQIGCLMWCFDADEQQNATAENTLTVTESEEAAAALPPETSSASPGKGPEPAPPTPAAGGSKASLTPLSGPPSPGSGSATSVPPAPPATPVLRDVALVGVASPTAVSKPRLRTRRSHVSTAPASMSSVRGSHTAVRREPAMLRAHLRRGVASQPSVGPAPASFGAVTVDAELGSRERADQGMPAAVLLAAIALCGLCCLGIAALRAREGSRARHAEN